MTDTSIKKKLTSPKAVMALLVIQVFILSIGQSIINTEDDNVVFEVHKRNISVYFCDKVLIIINNLCY